MRGGHKAQRDEVLHGLIAGPECVDIVWEGRGRGVNARLRGLLSPQVDGFPPGAQEEDRVEHLKDRVAGLREEGRFRVVIDGTATNQQIAPSLILQCLTNLSRVECRTH